MTNSRIKSKGRATLPTVLGFIDSNEQQWVEVTYKGLSALLPYSSFATDRGAIWSDLSSKGMVIVAKAAKASVIQQVEELEVFTDRLIFARPGWCQGQFANASGRVFAPRGDKKGTIAFIPNSAKCSRRGTHAKWKQQVAGRLVGHPIPGFAIMACLAAPLLELVGRTDNFGFEFSGEGGKGKSTTQRLMASAVGPAMEKHRGYITSFHMTPAAIEKSMQLHSDMPFIIDEANLFGSGSGGRADRAVSKGLHR